MEEQVLEAIRYFEAGNRQEAQKQLALVLKKNPEHEYAWLWLSMTMEDKAKQEALLQKVLDINPQNVKANQLLHRIAYRNGTLALSTENERPSMDGNVLADEGTLFEEEPLANGLGKELLTDEPDETESASSTEALSDVTMPEMALPTSLNTVLDNDTFIEVEPIQEEPFKTAVSNPFADPEIDATLLVEPIPFDTAPLPSLVEETPAAPQGGEIEGDEQVFQKTLDPYGQADSETEAFDYSKGNHVKLQKQPQRQLRKFILVIGAAVFASVLYLAAVSLLFNDNSLPPSSAEQTEATAVPAIVVAATEEPTEEPEATEEPTTAPTETAVPPTSTIPPTQTPEATEEPEPTATAVPPTATAETTTSPATSTAYLQAAQELAQPLEASFMEVISLASSIDFSDDAWHTALQEQANTLNMLAASLDELSAPSDFDNIHQLLQTTNGQCQTGTNHLIQGAEQEDLTAMQTAAPFLADCRDGIDRLNNIWASLPANG